MRKFSTPKLICVVVLSVIAAGDLAAQITQAEFLAAAREGDTETVRYALTNGSSPATRDAYNWTALMLASAAPLEAIDTQEHLELLQLLLSANSDPNARSLDGWTPLHFAGALGENPEAIELLLEAGARLEARTMESWTAEMSLTRYTGEQRMQRGLGFHDAGEQNGVTGYTPLMLAARFGREQMIKALLEAGADPRAKNEYGHNACELSDRNAHLAGSGIRTLLCNSETE